MNRNIYFVGFPDSGKTTYLAALWHLLVEASGNLQFKLHKYTGDRSYLNLIAEQWRDCAPTGRTSRTVREDIEIEVSAQESDQVLKLQFPDLSGETFDNAFSTRTLSNDDESAIAKSDGLMLFISADPEQIGVRIDCMGERYAEADDSDSDSYSERDWESKFVQEQVRLVDFLQVCSLNLIQDRNLRIAVVISAWDLIEDQTSSPQYWMNEYMPLLAQYLRNTRVGCEVELFGVSAQGATFDETLSDEHVEKLPSDRIKVVHRDSVSNDLSIPLAWLSN